MNKKFRVPIPALNGYVYTKESQLHCASQPIIQFKELEPDNIRRQQFEAWLKKEPIQQWRKGRKHE